MIGSSICLIVKNTAYFSWWERKNQSTNVPVKQLGKHFSSLVLSAFYKWQMDFPSRWYFYSEQSEHEDSKLL